MRSVLKAFLLLLALAVMAGAIGLWYFVNAGVSAKDQPGRVEEFLARRVRNMAIARQTRSLTNPVQYSGDVIAEGRAHFADHCATCHGNDGCPPCEVSASGSVAVEGGATTIVNAAEWSSNIVRRRPFNQ